MYCGLSREYCGLYVNYRRTKETNCSLWPKMKPYGQRRDLWQKDEAPWQNAVNKTCDRKKDPMSFEDKSCGRKSKPNKNHVAEEIALCGRKK